MKKKRVIALLISGIVMTVLIQAAVIALIRNLGSLISLLGPLFDLKSADVKQFSAIFAQLSNARIDPPFVVSILFGISFLGLLSVHRPKHTATRVILICIFGIVLFLFAVITVLLLTNVNGIRFANVLASLLQVLSAGGL